MRLPYSALVSSPTIEAGISFLAKDSTISLALGGAQASTIDPSLRDVKASIPKRLQTAEVSSEIWIDDFSTRIPSDEAAASSYSEERTPPSVESCIAVTP